MKTGTAAVLVAVTKISTDAGDESTKASNALAALKTAAGDAATAVTN
jgi:hypothetical protein